MKTMLPLALVITLLAACSPGTDVVPTAGPTPIATEPPPAGTVEFDGCGFTLNYPPSLALNESGILALFGSSADSSVEMSVLANRKSGAIAEEEAIDLAQQFPGFSGEIELESVRIIDHLGMPLEGTAGEFTTGDRHVRFLVVVRPETLLANLLPDDVVFELLAQSSESSWPVWSPEFDVIFQTFHPRDCGGV